MMSKKDKSFDLSLNQLSPLDLPFVWTANYRNGEQ
jgi:hypothetical protein